MFCSSEGRHCAIYENKIRQIADNDLGAKLQQPFYHSDILLCLLILMYFYPVFTIAFTIYF
jgi:hypothetical protein